MKQIFKPMLTLAIASSLVGCGGGGGGDDFAGAALVSIAASPRNLDPGDRTRVTIQIAEVDDSGIALKIRFPTSLGYVVSSATLDIAGDGEGALDVTPTRTVRVDSVRFVVFYFKRSRFGRSNQGTLSLQLDGLSEGADQIIGVDADIDDPKVSNAVEFDKDNPEFGAEDQVTVQIEN